MVDEQDIYASEIISHYEHPHNKGELESPDFSYHETNPVCGDDVTVYLKVGNDGRVTEAKFEGRGCAISMAGASMLTDLVKGKRIEDIRKMGIKDIVGMLGVDPGPARLKCATLSLRGVQHALGGKGADGGKK